MRLEASSVCQLRCPSCPTANGAARPAVGSGFLAFADFQRLVDENPRVRRIELSNYGEMFLNPDLASMLRHAHARGVSLSADNGVNLNSVGEDVLEALVRFQFRSMTCSIDAASAATYRLYRINGDFQRVIDNIRKLNEFKNRHRSGHPRLTWQFVVMGHNEREISSARQMARDLGMRFAPKLTWDEERFPVHDKEHVRTELGYASREEFQARHGRDYMQEICHGLWDEPQINWDGTILGCCRNFWGHFGGNAFRDGLLPAVNSEAMQSARELLLGGGVEQPGIPCTSCEMYLRMKATGKWLWRGLRRDLPRAARRLSRLLRRL